MQKCFVICIGSTHTLTPIHLHTHIQDYTCVHICMLVVSGSLTIYNLIHKFNNSHKKQVVFRGKYLKEKAESKSCFCSLSAAALWLRHVCVCVIRFGLNKPKREGRETERELNNFKPSHNEYSNISGWVQYTLHYTLQKLQRVYQLCTNICNRQKKSTNSKI